MRPLLILYLMTLGSFVTALGLEDLSPQQAAALFAGERPVVSQFKNPQPRLIPRSETLTRLVEELHRDLNPNIMVETLQIYTKPEGAGRPTWSDGEKAALYNSVLALSSLAGIEYFSASRGTMRILYEISTVIDSPNERTPVPDPSFPQPPPELTLFARQKDSLFGDNVYQYDFYTTDGAIIFIQNNLSSLNLGIIPAIGRNRLRSVVAIFDSEDHLLVYAGSMARATLLPGMGERVGISFANRAEAILNWFSGQADDAFSQLHRASSQVLP